MIRPADWDIEEAQFSHTRQCNSGRKRVLARSEKQKCTEISLNEGAVKMGEETIIVGGGIVGASTAYHLALKGRRTTVIEASEIASGASGKSGGFLASDWCNGAVNVLARTSFKMHRELAELFGAERIGYRAMSAVSIELAHGDADIGTKGRHVGGNSNRKTEERLSWMDGGVKVLSGATEIGDKQTCAQVTPRLLTETFVEEARRLVGTDVKIGKVVKVSKVEGGMKENSKRWDVEVESVRKDGNEEITVREVVEADTVILCMGPWSTLAQEWFPSIPGVMGHKAASLIVGGVEAGDTALFTRYLNADGKVREPEVYPRQDEIYICQSARAEDIAEFAKDVKIDKSDENDLKIVAASLSQSIEEKVRNCEYVAQACYLPLSGDGMPIIGQVAGVEGVYIACGHSCWGILNAPATGAGLAEIVMKGSSRIGRMEAFSPSRFG